ncbi:MAG: hypothetical protein KF787_09440 [Phycisphaeraceae bacterium]|nr:hypothetical protein [Phycisphaerae bacterium]MBX3392856.1 hypothetical protein [Phycisphaeraceae bacterium]
MRLPDQKYTLAASAAAWVACLAPQAYAQEAMYTEAATMPSPGTFVLREQVHYIKYGSHPVRGTRSTEDIKWEQSLSVGLWRGVALRITSPAVWRNDEFPAASGRDDQGDKGLEDFQAQFKWRVYQDDSGGIDTLRVALLGGATVASGDDHDFSSGSVNPEIGAVLTRVWDRHGFNQDLIYRFNTGGDREGNFGGDGVDDALCFNSAYLYRIAPSAYTAETTGSWYVTAEVNGLYETNGDTELRFSPGLMYEGRRWGFEVMAQLPLWHDLDERAELDLAIGIGFRLLF